MGQISLNLPQIGLNNSTEDAKIPSDFTTLQTVINGNLDTTNISSTAGITDAQLASPGNSFRKLIFFNIGQIQGSLSYSPSGQDFIIPPLGPLISNGTGTSIPVPILPSDSGIASQPQDFQTAGKTTYCRIRGVIAQNATATAVNATVRLLYVTGVGGSSGFVSYTLSPVSGTDCNNVNMSFANTMQPFESGQFALSATANQYFTIGINLSGGTGTTPAASFGAVTAGLYAYTA